MRNGTNGRPRKREQAGVRMRAPKRKRIRMKFEGVERHIHIKMLIELFGPLLYPTSFKYCMLGMFGFFFFSAFIPEDCVLSNGSIVNFFLIIYFFEVNGLHLYGAFIQSALQTLTHQR